MSADWFRNTTWDGIIERAFDEKLRRARRKEQYLRIQKACTLARSHPEVALKLLDRYFELQDDFDHAPAHVDRAPALLALGRVGEALAAYEAALTTAHAQGQPHRRALAASLETRRRLIIGLGEPGFAGRLPPSAIRSA